jgi:NTE family protein
MSKKRWALQLTAALLCCHRLAGPRPSARSCRAPQGRARAFGGGARGLAHIGVLKVLREQRVPVDFIVATSMGAIVGGAYAAGRTPEELESLVTSADWELMFADRPPREYLSFRRKEDDQRLIGKTELGVSRDGIMLPRAAFGSQNLEEFMRLVTRSGGDARPVNELPVPLHAVATDLSTGEQVVLSHAPLPLAMRASMSIPGAFSPTELAGRLLGDGGLTRNLPVEVARALGADVVIAVNVGTPLLPRSALNSALGVAQQMVNILTEQNVAISIAALGPQDILISPDLRDVSFLDFERGKDLIARGEAAGRAAQARLAKLVAPPEVYAQWESRRTRQPVASRAAGRCDPGVRRVAHESRGAEARDPRPRRHRARPGHRRRPAAAGRARALRHERLRGGRGARATRGRQTRRRGRRDGESRGAPTTCASADRP